MAGRGECVEYRDDAHVYRFEVRLRDNTWVVLLPGSKGDFYETYELSDSEEAVILPRLRAYLEAKRHFVLFGRTYPVTFEADNVSEEMKEKRRRVSKFLRNRKS
jgi:hypothetical protein